MVSRQETARPLLTPGEVMQLPATDELVMTIVFSTLAGYALSRYRSALLSTSAFYLLFVRMFPPIVLSLPLFVFVTGLASTIRISC